MKALTSILFMFLFASKPFAQQNKTVNFVKGSFADDYGIRYTISDSIWLQQPNAKYHIIKWNLQEQYIIAKNDTANKTDKGLYTRIDFMPFENMLSFTWGFCLTVYDAATAIDAEKAPPANRNNPKKGCNGYPFSRMKPTE